MPKFRRINIDNIYAYADTVVMDRVSNTVVYASIVGYSGVINVLSKEINKTNSIYIEGLGYNRTSYKQFEIIKRKQNDSDFAHIVIYKKDETVALQNSNERFINHIFYTSEEEKENRIYDKLYSNTPVPILREWMSYLISEFERRNFLRSHEVYYDTAKPQPFFAKMLIISKDDLVGIISQGLQNRAINMHGGNTVSQVMTEITGLDSYLNTFGETLAEKIQESFVPKFIPGESKYNKRFTDFDDNCYYIGGIDLYDAQRMVIQASVNNLNKNDVGFVIGEMGSGKTLLGCGITYAHAKKDGNVSVILCPSHLCNKWSREVERLVPNGKAYIIKSIKDIIELDSKIRDKSKTENMYLIISKESAKFGYEMRPSAIWSESKRCFVCPECGKPLTKKVFVGSGRFRAPQEVPMDERDFAKQYAYNQICENKVRVYNKEEHAYKDEECHAKLWTPLNGDDKMDWVKLGSEGWILERHIDTLFDQLSGQPGLTRKDSVFLAKLAEKKIEKDSGELKASIRAPRKFPIAKYLKKYYKGSIDYLLIDEMKLRLLA